MLFRSFTTHLEKNELVPDAKVLSSIVNAAIATEQYQELFALLKRVLNASHTREDEGFHYSRFLLAYCKGQRGLVEESKRFLQSLRIFVPLSQAEALRPHFKLRS